MARNSSRRSSALSAAGKVREYRRARNKAGTEGGDDVVKEVAKEVAGSNLTKFASRKAGVPLAGVEGVIDKPTSVKAWSIAGARSGVAMALTAVSGVFGGYIEQFIHKVGYKRLLIGAAVTALMSTFVIFVMVAAVVASVTEAVIKPVTVIGSMLDTIPGYGPDSEQMEGIPHRMCTTQPAPRGRQTSGDEEGEGGEGLFVPDPAVDEEGKITEKARRLMVDPNVTSGKADPLRVETWMLYVLSHHDLDPKAQWDNFTDAYREAYEAVSTARGDVEDPTAPAKNSNSGEPSPAPVRHVRTDITPIELVMHIDPRTFYDPFLLPAATMTSALALEEGMLNQTDEQLSTVLGRMSTLCGLN